MTAKEYLQQYLDLENAIKTKEELRKRFEENAENTTSLYGFNSSSSGKHPSDKVANNAVNAADLEIEIADDIEKLIKLRAEIYHAIKSVNDTQLQSILEKKYILGYTLEMIAVEMHYSYRQVRRKHGRALKKICPCMSS